jgi:hypothetical protein
MYTAGIEKSLVLQFSFLREKNHPTKNLFPSVTLATKKT